MEVLSIQQHARDTLSRLRMRKRNKNWARDHMSWGNLLEGGDGTKTWARGAAQRRIWWVVAGQRLHRGWTEEAGGCVVSGLRLDRGESRLHRDVPGFVASHVAGSTLAILTIKTMFGKTANIKYTVTQFDYPTTIGVAFAWEFFISFVLMLTICGVATDTRAVSTCDS
ncbi:hypothetical protein Acr_07g0015780 [Actinidia rufa]|uniref:Uncharacterized protein n=1 Tax=Actinidia rufa TaxID=165716 RepID=A0A7J0EY71_9ERIC|nr:hypothetical protein Acr_07g0015780 [Actinidia rufa]